jgi:hypothetical protein
MVDKLELFRELALDKAMLYNENIKFQPELDPLDIWKEYSKSCLPVLDHLITLNELVFYRYKDEFLKDSERLADAKDDYDNMVSKLQNLASTQLDFSILLHQYTLLSFNKEITNELDVRVEDKKELEVLLKSLNHLNFSGNIACTDELPPIIISPVQNIILDIRENEKLLRDFLLIGDNTKFIESNGEIFSNAYNHIGGYYIKRLSKVVDKIGKSIWWEDPWLNVNINQMVLKTYDKFHNIWENRTQSKEISSIIDRNQLLDIPTAKAKIIMYKLLYYYELGILNASKGLHRQSIKYFELIQSYEENFNEILKHPLNEETRNLKARFNNLMKKIKLVNHIVKLSSYVNSIQRELSKGDLTSISDIIEQIKTTQVSFIPEVDLPFISALPSIYSSITHSLELQIRNSPNIDDINLTINQFLENFLSRIDTAIIGLESKWDDAPTKETIEHRYHRLTLILDEVNLLHETISLLPRSVIHKDILSNSLLVLKNLVISILYDYSALEHADSNPIIALLYKISASHHAKIAYDSEKNTKIHDNIPVYRIETQFIGTFTTSNMLEIRVYKLVLEYLFINELSSNLTLAITQDPETVVNKEDTICRISNSLDEPKIFFELLNRMVQISNSTLEFSKSNETKVEVIELNEIKRQNILSRGVLTFYKSVKLLIMSSLTNKLSINDEAMININNAIEEGFKAAEILSDLNDIDPSSEFSKHVFSFAQLCQNLKNSEITNSKPFAIPVNDLLNLLKTMLFAM